MIKVDADWHRLTCVALSRPDNFRMAEPVNRTQRAFYGSDLAPRPADVLAQHDAVRTALLTSGVTIVDIPSLADTPLQFNVRDAAVVVGADLILCRMRHPIRAQEPSQIAQTLPGPAIRLETGYFEGGDVIVTPDVLFIGIGERTDAAGCEALDVDRKVVPILLAPGVLHLDVALTLLAPHLGVIHRPALAGALPPELAGVTWVEVTHEEFLEQAANVLVLTPGTVMLDARHHRLRRELQNHGIICITVVLDEITKIGGGVRCMTLPLARSPQ